MNDPGLDEPTQEAAQDVEHNADSKEEEAEQEEDEYLDPRYSVWLLKRSGMVS